VVLFYDKIWVKNSIRSISVVCDCMILISIK